MSKLNSKASSQIGKPPGSLIFVGKKKIEKSRISVLSYNEKTFEEKELKHLLEPKFKIIKKLKDRNLTFICEKQ